MDWIKMPFFALKYYVLGVNKCISKVLKTLMKPGGIIFFIKGVLVFFNKKKKWKRAMDRGNFVYFL